MGDVGAEIGANHRSMQAHRPGLVTSELLRRGNGRHLVSGSALAAFGLNQKVAYLAPVQLRLEEDG